MSAFPLKADIRNAIEIYATNTDLLIQTTFVNESLQFELVFIWVYSKRSRLNSLQN